MPEHPDKARTVQDERRIGELLAAVEVPAPAALSRAIIELALKPPPARRRRRRTPVLALAGGFAAGIVLALVLKGGPAPPTVLRVSTVALARATGPAPRSLIAAGTSIAFPQWSARGWPTRGARRDSLDGRTVTTEFYSSYRNGMLGYAIVSGAPLKLGAGWHALTHSATRYELTSAAGAQVVAWVQDGHTCVLASRTASAATLLALAVAQDGGAPV